MRLLSVLLLVLAAACSSNASAPPGQTTHSTDFAGARVVYSELGSGDEALVFVHGWACDRSVWDEQMKAVGARHAIAIDLPGHGASSLPAATLSMDLFARSIAAVLDDAHVARAVLVGHSNGTPVTREFFRLYPQRTAGLVVVDGALRAFFDDPKEADGFLEPLRGANYLANATKLVDGMLPPTATRAHRDHIRSVMLATPQRTMVEGMQAALDPSIWRDDKITVPVLVVLARSRFWDAQYENYVRDLCPDVEYDTLDGVSHFLMLDKPAEFNALLVNFLNLKRIAMPH
jgi:pimeloyl-ACP methyl ester carboxylesterase